MFRQNTKAALLKGAVNNHLPLNKSGIQVPPTKYLQITFILFF